MHRRPGLRKRIRHDRIERLKAGDMAFQAAVVIVPREGQHNVRNAAGLRKISVQQQYF
jgi:hypothetical protein